MSPDSRTAWVTLERNNAIAVVDLVDRARDRYPAPRAQEQRVARQRPRRERRWTGGSGSRPWRLRSWYQPDYLAAFTTRHGHLPRDRQRGRPARLQRLHRGRPRRRSDARSGGVPELGRAAAAGKPGPAAGQPPGRQECERHIFTRLYAYGGRSLAIWTTAASCSPTPEMPSSGSPPPRCRPSSMCPMTATAFDRTSPGARPGARGAGGRDDRRSELRLRGLRADRRGDGVRHHRSRGARTSSSTSTTGTSLSIRPRSARRASRNRVPAPPSATSVSRGCCSSRRTAARPACRCWWSPTRRATASPCSGRPRFLVSGGCGPRKAQQESVAPGDLEASQFAAPGSGHRRPASPPPPADGAHGTWRAKPPSRPKPSGQPGHVAEVDDVQRAARRQVADGGADRQPPDRRPSTGSRRW